ncbi:MAG: alpha/beta fold hydrolase [Rhodothermia bacterium]
MHFEKSGPKASEHILLLHGWGSSAELMRPLARLLEDRFFIVNADLPGHGQTPPPDVGWGVPEYAESVAQLIKSDMHGPVTIIGHSNGGRIGLFMASHPAYQELIRRLILISPSGMRPARSWKYYSRRGLASTLKAPFLLLPGQLKERGLHWLRESAIWRSLGSSDYKALSGVMRETFVKTVTTHLDGVVHKVAVPTLVLRGSRDEDVGRDQVDRLVELVPDAGLVELEGAGHYGYLDDPETVKAAIQYFMEHS